MKNNTRSKEIIYTVVFDFLALMLGWYVYYASYAIESEVFFMIWGVSPLMAGLVMSIAWIILLAINGLYKKMYLISRLDEFIKLGKATALGTLILFFFITTNKQSVFLDAQVSTLMYFIIIFGVLSFDRFIIRTIQRIYARRGKGLHRALIVGCGETAQNAYEDLLRNRTLGMNVVGFVHVNGYPDEDECEVNERDILGSLKNIKSIIDEHGIQDVIVALEPNRRDDLIQVISNVDIPEITVKLLPDFYQLVNGLNKTNQIFGLPLIEISPDPMPIWEKIAKRLMDFVFSITVLIITAPLSLIIAILIRATSKGPAIYKQKRVGKYGKQFTMYKFRTMYENAEEKSGPTWAQENDPRITPVGYWLRKLRLDEIPQLLNVLKGNMSLVGPRPERPYFVEKFRDKIPLYSRRLRVRPGITGWAQVKWKYDSSLQDVREKTKYDLFYVENMSLRMDLKILINTVVTVLRAKGL